MIVIKIMIINGDIFPPFIRVHESEDSGSLVAALQCPLSPASFVGLWSHSSHYCMRCRDAALLITVLHEV